MLTDDGIINKYLQKFEEGGQAGAILVGLYCELFELPYSTRLIPEFARLAKIYGKKTLFNAILNLLDFKELTHDKITNLLSYLCKKQYTSTIGNLDNNNLDSYIESLDKQIKQGKKLKLKFNNIFEEKT